MSTWTKSKLNLLIVPVSLLIGILLALIATSLLVLNAGENPLRVFSILLSSSFGTTEAFSSTLFYTTPLLLTGAAVIIPLRAGLFNIGAEGQLHMGALGAISYAALLGSLLNENTEYSWFLRIVLVLGGFISAAAAGASWGCIAGYLRAKRKVHEVIVTIMMNFIAIAMVNWFILNPYKNLQTQAAETFWIHSSLRISKVWHETPGSFFIALILSALTVLAIRYTWWGYRLRAVGENPGAAHVAGIKVDRTMIVAMTLGGAFAGLVGFHEVYAHAYRLIDGFSAQFGFTGIAVALLSRGRVSGLLAASLMLGALHKGALELDLETEHVTRDLAAIIQAFVLVALAVTPAFEHWIRRFLFKREKAL